MKQSDRTMKRKIHAVKSWLEKAEHSYEEDAVAKGQLQLLLAKAEMQHLEETSRPWYKRGYVLIIPLVLVMGLMVGIYFWHGTSSQRSLVPVITESAKESSGEPAQSKGAPEQVVTPAAVVPVDTKTVSADQVVQAVRAEEAAKAAQTKPVKETVKTVVVPKESPVPKHSPSIDIMDAKEIQQTVYDAGRSLRGN